MTKRFSLDAMKPGINSTGGQASARAASPAGHFSHSDAVTSHGTAGAGGGGCPHDPAVALIKETK